MASFEKFREYKLSRETNFQDIEIKKKKINFYVNLFFFLNFLSLWLIFCESFFVIVSLCSLSGPLKKSFKAL